MLLYAMTMTALAAPTESPVQLEELEVLFDNVMVCDHAVESCPDPFAEAEPEPGCDYDIRLFIMFQFCDRIGFAELYESPFPAVCPPIYTIYHPFGGGDWSSLDDWFDAHRGDCAVGDDGSGSETF